MNELFLVAARKKFRFASPAGLLTAEQLFDLPLTSAKGKANLNEVAINIAEDLDKHTTRSFVDTDTKSTLRAELTEKLELVKAVIGIRQAENAADLLRRKRVEEREKLLDAIEQADRRELGAKSATDLRKQLAELDG